MITCLEAPFPKLVSTTHFVDFCFQSDLYKNQFKKNRHSPDKLVPTSYQASIEDDDQSIFIVAWWTKVALIKENTGEQLNDCIAQRCKHELSREQLYLIGHAEENVHIFMGTMEPGNSI